MSSSTPAAAQVLERDHPPLRSEAVVPPISAASRSPPRPRPLTIRLGRRRPWVVPERPRAFRSVATSSGRTSNRRSSARRSSGAGAHPPAETNRAPPRAVFHRCPSTHRFATLAQSPPMGEKGWVRSRGESGRPAMIEDRMDDAIRPNTAVEPKACAGVKRFSPHRLDWVTPDSPPSFQSALMWASSRDVHQGRPDRCDPATRPIRPTV